VQWDQRGAGNTYAVNDPVALASSMTIEQMTSDAEEVVRYLLKQYGKGESFVRATPREARWAWLLLNGIRNGSTPI